MIATHVTINGTATYRLGQTSRNDTQIQCIAADGLVHRVCHWQPGGIEAGARLHTSGNDHHYHLRDVLRVGDAVNWRGGFGAHAGRVAKVLRMERVRLGESDGGTEVAEVPWDQVKSRALVVDLDNGHWAYGNQLERA
jgi:hypothetical protein